MSDGPTSTTEAASVEAPRALRLDPHIHTLASDGISDVQAILQVALARGLDGIAITDHERIDAAVAAKAMAEGQGLPLEVIVGECSMSVAELFDLRESSVVKLDREAQAPVDVLLDGKRVARGTLVAVDDNFGVRITEIGS